MSSSVRVLVGALSGSLLGLLLAGAWWLRLDGRTCLGAACDGTPRGDLTLLAGAVAGAALGLAVALALSRRRRRQQGLWRRDPARG